LSTLFITARYYLYIYYYNFSDEVQTDATGCGILLFQSTIWWFDCVQVLAVCMTIFV